jgi:hypothetical protein
VITGVTSHVLQVDGAAHVISDDRRDVRLLTGVKGVIRRRQPSAVGRVVVAVTIVAARRSGRDLPSSDRPGRKRPTMPERAATKATPRRTPASVAPAATENNADDGKEDYRYAASRQRKYRTGGAVSAGAHTPLPCAGIPT